MAKLVCDVNECSNEITEGTGSKGGLPICKTCRAAQYALKKQNKEQIQARRDRWHYWESRLDYLHPRILKMMSDAERRVTTAKRLGASARH